MQTSTLTSSLRSRPLTALAAIVSLALLGQGCHERTARPSAPCTTATLGGDIHTTAVDQVDLLFVIDNSRSMDEEQRALVDEVGHMVETLTTGVLADGTEVTPVHSLHVGVVSSDMGVGAAEPNNGCERGLGANGLLLAPPQGSNSAILAFDPSTDDAAAFAAEVSRTATLGADGCNYEQPLEAMLKALSPAAPTTWTREDYAAPIFWAEPGVSTQGHATPGGLNDGFLRPGAVLAVVLITDEDDCSAEDTLMFAGAQEMSLRCSRRHADQWDVQRYVDGLLGLRSAPSQIVFAAIVGVPQDLEGQDETQILADGRMSEVEEGSRLEASCAALDSNGNPDESLGRAEPPRRILQVAAGLRAAGASTSIHSICSASYRSAIDDVLTRIGGALGTISLPRALNLDAQGQAPCEVFEVLPAEGPAEVTSCADLPNAEAYDFDGIDSRRVNGERVERERCRVRQIGRNDANLEAGWYYDGTTGEGQSIGFSMLRPVAGAELQYRCEEHIAPTNGTEIHLGSFCDPGTGADGSGELAELAGFTCGMGVATPGYESAHMTCDAFDRTCQMRCAATSDCTGAGLLGYVCDLREASEYFGADLPAGISGSDVHGFCVNPLCSDD